MLGFDSLQKGDLMHCKCGLCDHQSRTSCINSHCYCCDLEDIFALLSHHEFEPQSAVATKEHHRELMI